MSQVESQPKLNFFLERRQYELAASLIFSRVRMRCFLTEVITEDHMVKCHIKSYDNCNLRPLDIDLADTFSIPGRHPVMLETGALYWRHSTQLTSLRSDDLKKYRV